VIKVLVAGEGPNELGGWAGEPSFRETSKCGVLEALMRALVPEGWIITHAEAWKRFTQPSCRRGRLAEGSTECARAGVARRRSEV
jgi:hypothetical protein